MAITNYLTTSVFAIIALINPFSNLPQYLAMTEDIDDISRHKIFNAVIITALIIVAFFTISGHYIMHYLFRIEIYHLRVAGGIILIVMGIKNLMFTKPVKINIIPTDTIKEMIQKSIIPMAFPMMVGPGTLSTVIVMSDEIGILLTLLASIIAFSLMFLLFKYSGFIEKIAGKLILHVTSRIMQIFIVAIGVKMLSGGIRDTIMYLKF